MTDQVDMPLFPLGLFLLPGERTELHIFEPRYRALLADCEAEGLSFGIPLHDRGHKTNVGSVVRVVSVSKRYPTGESDIIVEATSLIRIIKMERFMPGKPYPGGVVQPFQPQLDWPVSNTTMARFQSMLRTQKNVPAHLAELNNLSVRELLDELNPDPFAIAAIACSGSLQAQEKLLQQEIRFKLLLLRQEGAREFGFYLS